MIDRQWLRMIKKAQRLKQEFDRLTNLVEVEYARRFNADPRSIDDDGWIEVIEYDSDFDIESITDSARTAVELDQGRNDA